MVALKSISVGMISLSILWSYTLNPVTETDRKVDEYFFQALQKSKEVDYFAALEITRKISDLVPEHPAGYLFSTAVLSWIISDFYNYDYADEFMDEVDKTIKYSKKMINRNRLDPWGYIYLGGAYGFRGIYYSLIGSFYYAFLDGVRGNFELNKAIDLDPEIYDNYFGTGTFDFWKAYYSGKFFWLGDTSINKQTGIDKINLAIAKGKYTTLEADFSLIRIYLVDGRFQDAVTQALKLISLSPRSVKARRFLGIAYLGLEDYEKALQTFEELRDIVEQHPLRTPAAVMEAKMGMARAYQGMGDAREALSILEEARSQYDLVKKDNDFLVGLRDEYDRLAKDVQSYLSVRQ